MQFARFFTFVWRWTRDPAEENASFVEFFPILVPSLS
jgi:hypothetical protein